MASGWSLAKASRPLEAMNPPVGRAESRNCQRSQEGAVGVETVVVFRCDDSGVGDELRLRLMLSRGERMVGVIAVDIVDVCDGMEKVGCCNDELFGLSERGG